MCMFYFYYQKELPDLQGWQISLVMLVGSGLNLVAAYLATVVGKRWSLTSIFPIITGLTGLGFFLAILGTPLAYLSIYLVTNALYALFQPIYMNDLQSYLPSKVRATMLSISSMMFSLAMIFIFPMTGWLIDAFHFEATFVALGGVLMLLFPMTYYILQRMNRGLASIRKEGRISD